MRRTSCGMISEALGVDHMEKHGSDCARVGSRFVSNEGFRATGVRSWVYFDPCSYHVVKAK